MKKLSFSLLITFCMILCNLNFILAQDSGIGYSAGLNVSTPLVTSSYFDGDGTTTGPSVGVVVSTPYSFDLGSYSVGVGAGIELANMGADDNFTYTGFYLSLSTEVFELESGPISLSGALGIYGGLAATGSILYDYAIENQPIVIQPYARTAVLLDSDGNGRGSYLMSIGAICNYSF